MEAETMLSSKYVKVFLIITIGGLNFCGDSKLQRSVFLIKFGSNAPGQETEFPAKKPIFGFTRGLYLCGLLAFVARCSG